MTEPTTAPGAAARLPYARVVDPLPLESPEHNKLHAFYAHLAEGRLTTTRCQGCRRIDWPPRGFCPACTSDAFDWVDLIPRGVADVSKREYLGDPTGATRTDKVHTLGVTATWLPTRNTSVIGSLTRETRSSSLQFSDYEAWIIFLRGRISF